MKVRALNIYITLFDFIALTILARVLELLLKMAMKVSKLPNNDTNVNKKKYRRSSPARGEYRLKKFASWLTGEA